MFGLCDFSLRLSNQELVRTIAIFLTVKQVVDECEFWLFKGIFIELAIQQGFDFSDPETVRSLKK